MTLNPGAEIVERDLAVDPPPHPDLDFYEAILSPVPDDDPRFSLSEQMIRELEVADFVVIGTPMNNFSVPSTLKAWIDHIVRIRRTFRSLPKGKIGTLRDRPVAGAALMTGASAAQVVVPAAETSPASIAGIAPSYGPKTVSAVPNAAVIMRRIWLPGLDAGYDPQGLAVDVAAFTSPLIAAIAWASVSGRAG